MTIPEPEVRKLHPLSWLFMTATVIKGLIVPAVLVLFASGGNPLARYELLSLLIIGPSVVAALLKQGIYNYRFTAEELVIREGILVKKERHIPYDRVHNVAMVRNPFHRLIGVASARVETAAGGEAEAVMRVLSLDAVDELRRYTLGKERAAAGAVRRGEPGAAEDAVAAGMIAPPPLLRVPAGELVRLGLISNRGFLVVAAALGLLSQANWWDQDWQAYYERANAVAPAWSVQLLQPGSTTRLGLLVVGLLLLFVVLLRLFSVIWYLLKYYDFVLERDDGDLRTEFGLFTRVSSLIPIHRIQLLTISASLLHRAFDRAGIDLETAGAQNEGSEGGDQLAASGLQSNRLWLAPIIGAERASTLVREIIPAFDIGTINWSPLAPRAAARLVKKSLLAIAVITAALMAVLSLAPVAVAGWQALWLPAVGVPLAYLGIIGWVRHAGYALTDEAIFFRSGWLARSTSMVRFDKMQTVKLSESPFDRRHRMASISVDTAGAGNFGHRIRIPYLDVEEARAVLKRLYAEACATEFRW